MHLDEVYNHPISMEDRELYRRILGIEKPWSVASVDLQLLPKEVHIYLTHEELPSWPCAECGTASKLYDHQPERQWRHLDTCQYHTILHAESSTWRSISATPWTRCAARRTKPCGPKATTG